ncbi:hypothetical protein GLAREA_12922 [Glarea lozoyensis ATCC 20868]|uniref:Uncharacterized protein n=1 Tax=Glarea lozoyensis (strain ATCC 20868 / MF5171) TaxID=1116229 RepID=S3CZ49_GLAL2|nr:uncharacterized protein GLAREA_12922 [Glarea lozoyensis ATCC 20868]EPE30199.1 hypothetical protein GLAREA_12922 [Glarea lozoyensis ATCC 20868]
MATPVSSLAIPSRSKEDSDDWVTIQNSPRRASAPSPEPIRREPSRRRKSIQKRRKHRFPRTLRGVKNLVASKMGLRRASVSSRHQFSGSGSTAIASPSGDGINPGNPNAAGPRCLWAEEVGLDGAGRLPPIEDADRIPLMAFPITTDCYTFSPHTMSEAGSMGHSLTSKETPLFDIKKCTAEIERQRIVLRIKNVTRAQLQDICDHVFSRETIEKGVSPMALDDIVETRFDKLLEDILKVNYNAYQTGTKWWLKDWQPSKYFVDVLIPHAQRLQDLWLNRFGTAYNDIGRRRRRDMLGSFGSFRGIAFNPHARNNEELFIVHESHRSTGKSKLFGEQGFKPGDWWLNMYCAFRDGIVGDPHRQATQVPGGAVTALALLRGVEIDGVEPDTYEYTVKINAKEMMASLLGQRGRPVRLLRGWELESKYAPEAGLRYDGLYMVTSYNIKLIEHRSGSRAADMYQVKTVLKKREGQTSLDELSEIPSPKQMDDWDIFGKLIHLQRQTMKQEFRQTGSRPGYNTPLTIHQSQE